MLHSSISPVRSKGTAGTKETYILTLCFFLAIFSFSSCQTRPAAVVLESQSATSAPRESIPETRDKEEIQPESRDTAPPQEQTSEPPEDIKETSDIKKAPPDQEKQPKEAEAVPERGTNYAGAAGDIISGMTLDQKIGQLIIIKLWIPATGRGYTSADPVLVDLIQRINPGGVLLNGENLRNQSQVTAFLRDLQNASATPLFTATDQEGGIVSRLNDSSALGATPLPSPAVMGDGNDPRLVYLAGWITGRELSALGINMNFAPVADINTNPDNPVIGTRAFGNTPEQVSLLSGAFARGQQDAGVISVLKHFPGHGDTSQDTHRGVVQVLHDLKRLESVELVPFRSGINEGIECIMTAHIELPSVDPSGLPGSISPYINQTLLRDELGFKGLIITDSLAMGAISARWGAGEAAIKAIEAGADILLTPSSATDAFTAIQNAIISGRISEERIDESVRRILAAKLKRGIISLEQIIPVQVHAPEEQSLEAVQKELDLAAYRQNYEKQGTEVLGNPVHKKIIQMIIEAAGSKQ